ncbi:MAG: ATP-binding cassette domain-containing protein [Thermoanaerobaculia bacterium]
MPEQRRFLLLWAVIMAAGALAVATLGRYGLHVFAFGLLYGSLATAWSLLRATGLFSLGHAAFFGVGALMQAWLVTTGNTSPWLAFAASALVGAVSALPLIPALRLEPASFALATLAYAILLKGLAGNVPGIGMEGFLLPVTPALSGASPAIAAMLAALALGLCLSYEQFLNSSAGRSAAAIRQSPETAISLGMDLLGERWRPLMLSGAATALAGALYGHLVGSVEVAVVFSPVFSVLPLVTGMLGGALHPLGGILGTLALYPLDELILRPALPQAHALAYGLALVLLLLWRPAGLLRARIPGIPSAVGTRHASHVPFALAVRHLSARREGTVVLRDVTLAVEPGEILRVIGPNGAGKTSLLLAIAGRISDTEGAILFGGRPSPRRAAARARRGLARSFQAPRPFPEWTVRENVALAATLSGSPDHVDALLADLQLTSLGDRPAGLLSVGEGKRLELARVLASRPAVLLLDEPLAGLSPEAAERLSGLIAQTARAGAAVIWLEHGPAAGLASQVLVLEGGRIRYSGLPSGWDAARRESSSS